MRRLLFHERLGRVTVNMEDSLDKMIYFLLDSIIGGGGLEGTAQARSQVYYLFEMPPEWGWYIDNTGPRVSHLLGIVSRLDSNDTNKKQEEKEENAYRTVHSSGLSKYVKTLHLCSLGAVFR